MILSIDTSCDETSAAVTDGRRIVSNETYSQILQHKKWGGVVPNLAKRAHEERIDGVIESALHKAKTSIEHIEAIAVTYGPGLAIALGVGIDKAQELARKYSKPLIAVNHMEGHIYSCFAQNSKGNPDIPFEFPYLVLLASGSHTELVLFKEHVSYEIVGQTLDDAAGEALDKGARMILDENIYPGGPVIEKLAKTGNSGTFVFPRPMQYSKNLDFSFSGLKTSLLYVIREMTREQRIQNMNNLAASYQEAVVQSLLIKLEMAIQKYHISRIVVGGGVVANESLRNFVRKLADKYEGSTLFPPNKKLYGDNAAMIGIAAHYKAKKGLIVRNTEEIQREARAMLSVHNT